MQWWQFEEEKVVRVDVIEVEDVFCLYACGYFPTSVTLHGISGNKVNARTWHARTLKQKN